MSTTVRAYALYPNERGGFSNRSVHYSGTIVLVAATSIKQAYALAHKGLRATDPDDPLGILYVRRKTQTPDVELFNGARVFGNQLSGGERKTAIVRWMHEVLNA